MFPKSLITNLPFAIFFLVFPVLAQAQDYKKIHQEALVIDSHNDFLIYALKGMDIAKDLSGKTHSDLGRFKKGGIDAQFFSVWSDENYGTGKGYKYANRQIDTLEALIARNSTKMMLAKSPSDIQRAVKEQKLAALIGLEGGHMIEDNITYLDKLYARGVRYMTLSWNNSTTWASSAKDETDENTPLNKRGLTDLGKQIVKRMNTLGMLVDLSHVGEHTFWDALNTVNKPVLVSHSSVYAIAPHSRNLKDDQIKAIAKNGGVIQLNFYSGFLDKNFIAKQEKFKKSLQPEMDSLKKLNWKESAIEAHLLKKYAAQLENMRPPLSVLVNHLDYIVKLVGVDYVGLGSDFDGITSAPKCLNSVADMPLITKELVARGYSKTDIEKILGGNFMRVFKANVKE